MIHVIKLVRGLGIFVLFVAAVSASAEQQTFDACPSDCPETANASCGQCGKKENSPSCSSDTLSEQCNKNCNYRLKCAEINCSGPYEGQTRIECHLFPPN
jgi:hypothetical protein